MQKTFSRRDEKVKKLQDQATLDSSQAFKQGAAGDTLLYVPPRISFKDGVVKTYGGGFLFVEIKDGTFYPLEGAGSFEQAVAVAYVENVFVKGYTLDWDFPPPRAKMESYGLNDDQIKGFYLTWGLLKRAKDCLTTDSEHQKEKLTLSKEVSLSEESFALERKDGTVLVDFEGVWENWTTQEDGKKVKKAIRDLFLLVQRQEGRIRIVSCPEHLKTFFADCMGSYTEGERFLGVPQPLQAILQAQYGACQTKALITA